MKNPSAVMIVGAIVLAWISSGLSQSFVNLDFEDSIVTSSQPAWWFAGDTGMANVPSWTEFNGWGDANYSDGASVIYNNQTLDSPNVSLWDASYPNPAIEGNFSLFLYGGDVSSYTNGASMGQTGQIPLTAKSITYWGNRLQVTFNGQMLLLYAISNAANYTIYGADISAYSGQTGELLFTAPFRNSGMLDNIQFSSTPLPELNGLIYITNAASITITGYNGPNTAVVIPGTINGYTVTSIGDHAFDGSYGIASPTSITIPDSVTNIGNSVFYGDTSLTNVTIGQGVINIGMNDFINCISLNAITVNSLNPAYTSIAGVLFSKDTNNIIQYPSGITNGSYILPVNVVNIGASAFYQCGSLTNIAIPSGVTNIGDVAFYFCTNLSGFVMPNKVTGIGSAAFESCGLTSVIIPNTVTSIESQTFAMCESLTNVTMFNGLASIGDSAFSSCVKLTSMWIPDSVTNIGNSVFASCVGLTNVALGTNIISIGNGAFSGSGLTSITIPSTVTNIGSGAFGGCANLTAITVDTNNPDYSSVDGALFDKAQTTLIQYPIGKVGNFVIPNTITSIGLQFEGMYNGGMPNLTGITIPDSVTNISTYAFYQCEGLTNVIIGNNVTSIGQSTFMECGSLTWVTMGKSINYIGLAAFDFCGNLQGIIFQGNPPYIWLPLFDVNPNLVFYYSTGAAGWSPQVLISDGKFGVQNNQFGFTITGTSGLSFIVQASTNLEQPVWMPVSTNTLAGTTTYFSDPQWLNYPARFYHLRSSAYDGYAVALWNPQMQTSDGSFGVHNNQFGLTIIGTANIPIVVEGCTNLTNASWTALQSCTLTNGSIYFSDAQWTNYPSRFYRISSP
jgi:hypothetical protein